MKKKIASTKMTALPRERRMVASSSLSATISARGRRGRAAPPATKPPLMAPPAGAPAEGGSGPAAPAPRDASTASSAATLRSEEHTSELQSRLHLVCRLLLEKKKKKQHQH